MPVQPELSTALALLIAVASAWTARAWAEPEVRHWLGPEARAPHGILSYLLLSLVAAAILLTQLEHPLDGLQPLPLGLWSGLLTACALTDLRCRLLPDRLTLSLGLLGLALPLLGLGPGLIEGIAGALLGYGMPWLLGRVMARRRGDETQEAIGRGDLALLGAMGLWVGFSGLALVIIGASLLMLPLVAWGMLRRGWTGTTVLPFGPSLCLAGVLVLPWVFNQQGPA